MNPYNSGNKCAGFRPTCQSLFGSGLRVVSWYTDTYQGTGDGTICNPSVAYLWKVSGGSGQILYGPFTTGGCYYAPPGSTIHWHTSLPNWAVPYTFPSNTTVATTWSITPGNVSGEASVHS
ncbi:MAG: hypothetical protein QOJ93_279 [Actinomycetota bacterium]|nr:hypothetical protein [Actinomycetota bacterium]